MSAVTVPLATLAGVVSFASPCFLPIVPAYVSYVAGDDAGAGTGAGGHTRLRAAAQALVFVAGFTLVFVSLWVSLGLVGYALADHRDLLRVLGGAVLLLMGLHLAGVLQLSVLLRQVRLPLPAPVPGRPRVGRSFLLGVAFAAGWTPCIGPILGGVIGLATTTGSVGEGTVLLLAYSLGLGLPFVLVAVGAESLTGRLSWLGRHHDAVSLVAGLLLVALGFLMITDRFGQLAGLVPALGL
ncbi:cytochrome c biogenesis CcdA family protein [uncultured Ornithinimicrobium sp.]|uniref:cytochrome c biogenesis CcdA family protein n=1 Tax=uncultured Ornithinimicrobium sp. TaxID=259307 RepID=UPI00259170C3|nr:cytochrome c biogenesis protein CcdA [uncultured Ornithinimicrobium sp.]